MTSKSKEILGLSSGEEVKSKEICCQDNDIEEDEGRYQVVLTFDLFAVRTISRYLS